MLAGMMGLYGVIFGLIIILIHLAGLQSFGVPYLTPLAHGSASDMLKAFARPFWWMTKKRAEALGLQDNIRQSGNANPRRTPFAERELTHEKTEEHDAGKR